MKIYQILIILSLIIFIKNIEFCDLVVSATGPEDCKNLLKASYVNYCCFFKGKWKGQDYSACMDITPIRYNEMDDYIKEMNSQNGYKIEKIDCKSYYVQLGIMYLFFFLL